MKNKQNQKGVAHLMLIALVVVVAGAIGGAAWRISSSKSNPNKPHVDKQVQSTCLKEINDDKLCKFAASFNLNTSYVATATITGSSSDGTMTIKTDGKGNTSLSSNAGGQQLDSITLGSNTYIKDETSGNWLKYTSDSTNSADSANPADNLKISANDLTNGGNITYKYIGTDTCGSKTCYKYQQMDKTAPTVTEYIWFDTKDYQLQRFSYSDPSTGTTDMTFVYQTVNIAVPSPVQDASSSSSGSTPSQADINAAIQAAENAASSSSN